MRVFPLSLLGLCILSPAAFADSPWAVNIGVSLVTPDNSTGTLANGVYRSTVSDATSITPAIEYTVAPNWVCELLLAVPLKHDVNLSGGGLNDTKEASFTELPPTLSLKYLFLPGQEFSPYIGAGVNYTLVYGEKTHDALANADLKAGNSVGFAGTAGFEYRPSGSQWGFGADLRYINLKSKLTLNGNDVGTLEVNPWVYTVGANYHF
jgi:outer membrane protein